MKILVIGTPRSGSHWPVDYLQKSWACQWVGKTGTKDRNIDWTNLPDNVIVHSHDFTDLPINKEEWHLIFTYRRDLFDQLCSILYCQHTGEWTFYADNKIRNPIELTLNDMIDAYTKWCAKPDHATKIEKLLNYQWKTKTIASYEEMSSDITCLNHLKPTDPPENAEKIDVSHSSKHDYSKLISNYNELRRQGYEMQLDMFEFYKTTTDITSKDNFENYIKNCKKQFILDCYNHNPTAVKALFLNGQNCIIERKIALELDSEVKEFLDMQFISEERILSTKNNVRFDGVPS